MAASRLDAGDSPGPPSNRLSGPLAGVRHAGPLGQGRETGEAYSVTSLKCGVPGFAARTLVLRKFFPQTTSAPFPPLLRPALFQIPPLPGQPPRPFCRLPFSLTFLPPLPTPIPSTSVATLIALSRRWWFPPYLGPSVPSVCLLASDSGFVCTYTGMWKT